MQCGWPYRNHRRSWGGAAPTSSVRPLHVHSQPGSTRSSQGRRPARTAASAPRPRPVRSLAARGGGRTQGGQPPAPTRQGRTRRTSGRRERARAARGQPAAAGRRADHSRRRMRCPQQQQQRGWCSQQQQQQEVVPSAAVQQGYPPRRAALSAQTQRGGGPAGRRRKHWGPTPASRPPARGRRKITTAASHSMGALAAGCGHRCGVGGGQAGRPLSPAPRGTATPRRGGLQRQPH